ncbi:MAG: filamentous hemagglutinin N-terminal domain-containing protein, partial [Leptothrix sp. (in: b-proteobacteria)]
MSKHRPHSRTPSPIRPQRTLCNLAALAALGLLTLGEPVRAAPAGTLLPANTIPVLRPGRTPSGITVNAPTAYTAPNGQVGQSLRIDQAAAKAIVEWQQFNIGRGSKVEFVQPSATAAVLNRIFDADPSIIQGQLKANGQVYLINQNGILFDRGSQIDVNTLIASTLNLSDDTFNNPQGLTAGGLSNPALFGGYDANGKTLPSIKTERIVIGGDAGGVLASATAPAIHAAKGGAVMLFAPLIDNQTGVITAPDGQVILAAGRRAYLQFSDTPDFQMRGMLVEVTADGDKDLNLSSLITNSGTISADRGNVTLAALAINQRGRISATSAMQANGSIYLQARNNPTVSADFTDVQRGEALRQGTVTLSAGSVTETPLDLSDTSTMRAADDYTAFRSRVWIDGAQIVHQGTITSHAGDIRLSAFDSQNLDAARLYLDSGSVIDASGVWSDASNRSNLLTFKVTSNELKDSPDQKAGVLRGAIVTVDLRAGSSVLDLSGYRDNQAQSLLQKAAAAGVVTLKVGNADSARPISHGSLIQRANSVVNVAGGGVRYLGSTESTTKLVGA